MFTGTPAPTGIEYVRITGYTGYVPRDPHIYYNAIGVLGVLVLLFDVVLWVVGACFLMFFCLGVFGVWLVRVLLVCVWLGYVLEGYKSYKVTFVGFFVLRNLET